MTRTIGRILVMPAVLLIRLYRLVLAPLLPPVCRFEPSCSRYCEEALLEWGPIRGTWLGIRRLLRCRPGGGAGPDPVPERRAQRPVPPAASRSSSSSSRGSSSE